MTKRVSAKIKRSLKAVAVVGLAGIAAMIAARPFVHIGDRDESFMDGPPPMFMDAEAEHSAKALPLTTDSELEDRATRPVENHVRVGAGDTLGDVLARAGVDGVEATQAIEALRDVFNPRALKAGQKVKVTFEKSPHGFGHGGFQMVSLNADPIRVVGAQRDAKGGFGAIETMRQVSKQVAHNSGQIKSSLFESAQNAGVPVQIIMAMIKALSYDVDFQRDIQSGDEFTVVYEGFYDTKGKLVRHGEMLYAAVNLSGNPIAMYRFDNGQGTVEYFNEKGESVKKALLKTPVDGAKITSGFGMRNHPILGYSKMHKGIDFGVPTGTPIQAAGDGTVEIAGFNGSYGNYVRLRHGSGFGTAYAHMSRIATGIAPGKRVAQGQIIGFVGTTGRSTGAHLHYEVLRGKDQINPLSVKMPTTTKLAGRDLDRFKTVKRDTDVLMVKIPPSTRLAANALGKSAALTN
ncbi:M23 family metallopeptidase [Magnetospirillum sulfuroxidans]|uniref:Peptidoglycan DD-metalloendopeptidase family protein n=1 Tax=Magnetospirillum sulfuroxidans TaxID=611300 RepID=A0ABS5IBU2_9PROT|nr:peptidoglycan DD-metalloendopeptidase family protein [Magnetospirillum sulfuroxidans]MBR9971893.1 peptidoglycan DD-metalloendopeptidase family protein [Magnetospirillum sulfuroxidans]